MAVERLWRRRSKEGVVGVDDEVDGVDDGDDGVDNGVIKAEGGGKHDNQLAKLYAVMQCDVAARRDATHRRDETRTRGSASRSGRERNNKL